MKHPEELKTKFLELRAQGVSYGRIAEAISVSKPTLIQWGKAMAEEIADLQAAERELVREKLLGNFEQWLGRQVHHFNRLDAEFGRRELKYSPTESVFRMMMASRKLLDRYFFEDDRPSRRASRDHAKDVAPPPAGSQSANDNHNPIPESESNDGPPARKGSTVVPCPGGEDQDEGDSRSLSVAAPQPLADNALETGAYSENPAKTQPFPSQNCGVHNPALSSPPRTPVQPDLGSHGLEITVHSLITESEPRSVHTMREGSCAVRSPGGEGQDEGDSNFLRAPQSKIETPNSKMAEPSDAEVDFGGESVPINPFESTRQWLERQGIQVSKIPKGARIITAT